MQLLREILPELGMTEESGPPGWTDSVLREALTDEWELPGVVGPVKVAEDVGPPALMDVIDAEDIGPPG